jgi:hypothetical protein
MNSEKISDPDVLEPGQVLVIPRSGAPATRVENLLVVQEGKVGDRDSILTPPAGSQPVVPTAVRPTRRTLFYSKEVDAEASGGMETTGVSGGQDAPQAVVARAVPAGLVYSAEWLSEWRGEEPHLGTIRSLSEVKAQRTPRFPAQVGEEVVIRVEDGVSATVGERLQAFRTLRRERALGTVYQPTGVLTVTGSEGSDIRARVNRIFGPVEGGDLVRYLPGDLPGEGSTPVPVESNVTAQVVGFPRDLDLPQFGSRVFLDVGAPEGIVIGDIFTVPAGSSTQDPGMESARLQVVLVQGGRSTATIIDLRRADLAVGDRSRLIAKMR